MEGLQYLFSFSVPDPQRQWWDFATIVHDELQDRGIDDSKLDLSESWDYIIDVNGVRVMSWGAVYHAPSGKRYLIRYNEHNKEVDVYLLL